MPAAKLLGLGLFLAFLGKLNLGVSSESSVIVSMSVCEVTYKCPSIQMLGEIMYIPGRTEYAAYHVHHTFEFGSPRLQDGLRAPRLLRRMRV